MEDFSKHAIAVGKTSKAKPFFSDAFAATEGQPDLIHISVLPWLNFTGFAHAVRFPVDGVRRGLASKHGCESDEENTHHDKLLASRLMRPWQERFKPG